MENLFRTLVGPVKAPFGVTHHNHLLLAGSCFTEHIGQLLSDTGFNTLRNPAGIAYNPISLVRSLEQAIQPVPDDVQVSLFEHQGLWHHWDYHSHFSGDDKETVAQGIVGSRRTLSNFMAVCDRIVLTPGTADVFEYVHTGEIVANCHKMPAANFKQRRLSVEEIVRAMASALERLKKQQPDLAVILTVSPVRHTRAGMIENQRSKAVLLLACAELADTLPFVHYFPAYEIMMDELRDYRFYAGDMLHPSELAVEYIWQQWQTAYCPASTKQLAQQIQKLRQAAAHRPFRVHTPEHQAFVGRQLVQLDILERKHPFLNLNKLRSEFQQQIQP